MRRGILFVCVCLVSCGQLGNEEAGYQLDAENLAGLEKAMPAMAAWLIEDFEVKSSFDMRLRALGRIGMA